MFRKVLYATDLKDQIRPDGKRSAICLDTFRELGAEDMIILHVLDSRSDVDKADTQLKEDTLNRLASDLRTRGWNVEIQMKEGVPFDSIITTALENDVSVLAVGSGKGSKFKRNLLGETTYRILQMCPVPVFVCKNRGCEGRITDKILFGEDFSNSSHEAFKYLKEMAARPDPVVGQVTLLHVHEQSNLELLLKLVPMEKISQVEDMEKERLEEMAELLSGKSELKTGVEIRRGHQVMEFLKAIEENKSTLVVMGAQGKHWSEQFRIGGTALKVAEESPVPIFIVPFGKMEYPL